MENPNSDETRPTPVDPQDTLAFDLSDTQPTNITSKPAEAPDPAQTLPVPVEEEPALGPGNDATLPVEVHPTAEEPGEEPALGPGYDATLPVEVHSPTPPLVPAPAPMGPLPPGKKPRKRFRIPSWASWSMIGLVGLLLIAMLSAFGGYNEGIRRRKQAEVIQEASLAVEQFQLGLQDMEAGHYDRAKQRFEYVIEINPSFPGVTEKLADALLYMNATATPTVAPTPTITPTPDTRNVEQLFSQAQQDLSNSNWDAAINTLLSLRKADPVFQPVWVDDMLFIAYRNRGKNKILGADLEGGIYDLTIAEQFGYLDVDSRGLQDWARLYLTGASFWEIDWSQAVFYFAQVAPALPNLSDGSGWTAAERYRLALIGYGEDLIEKEEWCDAQAQLELALSMGPDQKGQELYDQASDVCGGGEEPTDESDEETITEEPSETEVPATEEPTTEPATTEPPPAETPAP